jgi:SAM-dependent methyltransferase
MSLADHSSFDLDDPVVVSTCDELPLWSAPFGLVLLDTVRLGRDLDVLDVGCGTGFPLLELAQRLGPTCRLVGVDPWRGALERVRSKLVQYGIDNVTLCAGGAERMALPSEHFDLVVSNNGLNNVADLAAALGECRRVCRPGAQLVATWNLPATMSELYEEYEALLRGLGRTAEIDRLHDHIHAKRKTVVEMSTALERHGFGVVRVTEHAFALRFVDGAALLRHYFIRLAFLAPWRAILPPADADALLAELGRRLDARALGHGELRLTIPFACLDCVARSR